MSKASDFLTRLVPAIAPVSRLERLRSTIGALVGILLTGLLSTILLGAGAGHPLLIAPMGASAVLLFAAPASPLAQPWSVLGGNTVAAAIGVTCALTIGDPIIAAAIAVSSAIAAMMALGCLHPPSGAVALTAVLGGPVTQEAGYWFVLTPVGINSLLILAVALIFNNATGRRYPHLAPAAPANPHHTADPLPTRRLGVVPDDLQAVLAQYDEVMDISPDVLDELLHQAQIRAYNRRSGDISCGEVMSRDVATVSPQTSLREAWKRLLDHRIKALPVTTDAQGLVGIVTQTDLMDVMLNASGEVRFGLGRRIRLAVGNRQAKPRTVADIMTRNVHTALPDTRIAKLVPPMADMGLHHIPVVDETNRLVGMVTQSDLVAALFQSGVDRATQAGRGPGEANVA
ncbi:HPP family protein [Mycoplana dimorpha]|uniref:CBS domain-containing membrane protein n=1 Tax=Mycoplana dimorpha TaxID=28320 RepID=A0A2T5B8Z7_MYCDI|nr:HPP family protein [Mycoplana dimorpha]PTM95434.1 CBS domain-containing membrane protein [Mycoplana dimorpha]